MPARGRTGVVVCGGMSRRMGHDKAALEVGGATLLERALATLRPVCDEVLLATGASPRYVELGMPIVLDRAPDLGPLAGLEAALSAARRERVVVLAVDMPNVDSELIELLCERAERDDCDALLAASADGVEPLCGVYHVRLRAAARAALDAGERRMTAVFAHALADGRRPRLETHDAECASALENVNTSDDLDRVRASSDVEGRTHHDAESANGLEVLVGGRERAREVVS